jgi:hypothetical protein
VVSREDFDLVPGDYWQTMIADLEFRTSPGNTPASSDAQIMRLKHAAKEQKPNQWWINVGEKVVLAEC